MKHITCIEDLRQRHMRQVPKAFFDYADRGSYAEETLRATIGWGRYAELFSFDEEAQQFSLEDIEPAT